MPDAEPLAETIEADATVAAASEIVDVTDAAVAEPDTEQATDPDAATDGGSASAGSTPLADVPRADRRDRLRKVGAIVFITVVVLGAATVTVTRSPFFAARTIEVRGVSHVPGRRCCVSRPSPPTPTCSPWTPAPPSAGWSVTRGSRTRRSRRTCPRRSWSTSMSASQWRSRSRTAFCGWWQTMGRSSRPRFRETRSGCRPSSAPMRRGRNRRPGRRGSGASDRRDGADAAPADRRHLDLADGQLRVDLNSGSSAAYGEPVELQEKAMALRALLDYAAERGATVVSVDVRVPSAPTALLVGGEVVTP